MKLVNNVTIMRWCVVIGCYLLVVVANARVIGRDARSNSEDFAPELETKRTNDEQCSVIGLGLKNGGNAAPIVDGGLLRAFHHQTVTLTSTSVTVPAMDAFRYTGGISGAILLLIPYAFGSSSVTSLDQFLDMDGPRDPATLTTNELNRVPEDSIFYRFTMGNFGNYWFLFYAVKSVGMSFIRGLFDFVGVTGTTTTDLYAWSTLMYYMMLAPFGISFDESSMSEHSYRDEVKTECLFSVTGIGPTELYPDYRFEIGKLFDLKFKEEFDQVVTPFASNGDYGEFSTDSTFGVFEGTNFSLGVLHSDNSNSSSSSMKTTWDVAVESQFQMSYGGYISKDEFVLPTAAHTSTFDIDGTTLAEPFQFEPVRGHPDDFGFSLKHVLGATTEVKMLNELYINLLGWLPGMTFPYTADLPTADGTTRGMMLTDGGFTDENSIQMLLQKKVQKLVVNCFMTSDRVASFRERGLDPVYEHTKYELFKYFGLVTKDDVDAPAYYRLKLLPFINHVFDVYSDDGVNQIDEYFSQFFALRDAGEPIIVTLKNLKVVENKFWGIDGGFQVDLIVIHNLAVPTKFVEQLDPNLVSPPNDDNNNVLDEYGFFTNPDVANVPNLHSFNLNPLQLLPRFNPFGFWFDNEALFSSQGFVAMQTTKQTRLTELLATWTVEHAWNGLYDANGNLVFEGFATLLADACT